MTVPKKPLLVGRAVGILLSLTTAAVAATSTSNDVSALAKAESQVVSVLKNYRDTATWKAQFNAAVSRQESDLAKVTNDLATSSAPKPTRTSATSCTGPCAFRLPAPDNLGFTSVALARVSQSPCPAFLCSTDIVYTVRVKMCAGPGGSGDASLEMGFLSLALSNGSQAPLDDASGGAGVPAAFGNYGTVAPGQCVTGDLYFDVTVRAQLDLAQLRLRRPVGYGRDIIYVWEP